MNLLTLYGTTSSSCLQGINIWLTDGEKVAIRILEGCCAVVPEKQMEWFTGVCLACKHEVVVTTEAALWLRELKWIEGDPIEAAKVYSMGPPPIRSHWTISSTFYAHITPDVRMMPLGHFSIKEFAPKAGEYK
ncbi:hypothetical protein A2U01_0040048, partial [Trifolium medium]|nr:hypothetical protein [Trifolium medium]